MSNLISDTEHWFREGRGKIFQFSATEEEVIELLQKSLLAEFAPYSVLGIFMVKEGNIYKHHYLSATISDFSLLRKREIWQFFIQSQVLSSDLPLQKGDNLEHLCAANGLLNLQPGYRCGTLPVETSIGIVNRVRHTLTGEVREHADYLKIFNALKRVIQSQSPVCKPASQRLRSDYGQKSQVTLSASVLN